MGHVNLPPLPRTRKWNHVVELVAGGAAAAQLATATINAAEQGFKAAPNDQGVIEAYWLLVRLPLAARCDNFATALRECGIAVADNPGLLDIAVGFSAAVDKRMLNGRGRTDLAEMAQTAAIETINAVAGMKSLNLFGSGTEDVQRAFASLGTSKQFGLFAWQFFSRFSYKFLSYFLGKALPGEIGEGKRFRTVAEQTKFTDTLRTHCREASQVLAEYAGDWFSLHRFQSAGDITREETQRGFGHAMTKLTRVLRRLEGKHGA